MINYNTLKGNLKRGLENYSQKISKGLGRPEFKFIFQMIYGLTTAQSCKLSEISRKLNEDILLKKTVDRLSRNLNNFSNQTLLTENYIETIKSNLDDESVIIIDGSDITKKYATEMEHLTRVRDGSTGEYGNGYHTLGVVALGSKNKTPIPIYSKVYTPEEEGFKSANTEVFTALDFVKKFFPNDNIRCFDRGYDNKKLYNYLLNDGQNFIIRAVKNRNVIYKNKEINILKLAKNFKGKYKLNFYKKEGKKVKNVNCKISMIPISLPHQPDKALNLVVCYGFGKNPMLLITNVNNDDKKLCKTITKVYLMRWRIEEYYRFIKQKFKLEDLRVRSLSSIRNLNLIILIASGYISIMSEKYEKNYGIINDIIICSKRIYEEKNFLLYAISDGLFDVLNFSKTGISKFLKLPPKDMQIYLYKHSFYSCA